MSRYEKDRFVHRRDVYLSLFPVLFPLPEVPSALTVRVQS